MSCVDCGGFVYAGDGVLQCKGCQESYMDYLSTRLRDVETHHETRTEFLKRMSKELGLNYTAYQIRSMIRAGMTDELILTK